ncbi:MAG TPA: helix-turn-helix domain-containing protein [Clostridium perfringens]|nr:helix-turn-helix domain-containing protein [Clostridium perfringens]
MFNDRLKELRNKAGLKQSELGEKVGVSASTIGMYEQGRRSPDREMLIKLSNVFNVTLDYLVDNNNINTDDTDLFNLKGDVRFLKKVKDSDMVKIPVLGAIRAGLPLYADENIIDYEYVHQEELVMGEETFFLEVKGDSMINARILDGDRVRIRKQSYLENNGDIMAVRVNGDEATLKRVYRQQNGLVLQSENPKYAPMFFSKEDVEILPVEIIGKAIEVKIKL